MTRAEIGAVRRSGGVVEGQLQALWYEQAVHAGQIRYLEARLTIFQRLIEAIRWFPSLAAQVRAVAPIEWKELTGESDTPSRQ